MKKELTPKQEDFMLESAREKTELKTLKDLKIFKWNDNEYENMDISDEEYTKGVKAEVLRKDSVRIEELKSEAIKWVKEIIKDRSIGVQLFTDGKKRKGNPIGKAIYGDEERKLINNEKIDWIISFFNLTEEDLK
jgi:hypothetical protein